MRKLILLLLLGVWSLSSVAAAAELPMFPKVRVETSVGSFVLELDGRRAPLTVRNFVENARSGHYDGTIFHRVIEGFMAQGGGYTADFEEKPTRDPIPNESGNGLQNLRGTIAMARTNDPHSARAQFYINLVDNPNLNPSDRRWGYCVFGTVLEGMEVLDKIAAIPTGPAGPFRSDVPQSTIEIESMELLHKVVVNPQ